MSGGNKQGGYTIVEVMMFLGISGALFVIAVLTIGGKQQQAQFAQGVRDLQSRIEDLTNDVATGYFPDQLSPYQCGYTGPMGSKISFSSGTTATQGKHDQCVFLGKVLFFNKDGDNFSVVSVAGGRATDQGMTIANYGQAKPVPINGNPSGPDLTDTVNIGNGIIVTDVISKELGNPATHPAAFGVFTSLPQYNASVTSGALTTDLISIPGSDINAGPAQNLIPDLQNQIENLAAVPPYINPQVVICLRHGSGGKQAALILGSNNRQAYTELHIDDMATAVQGVVGAGGPTCP